MKTIKNGIKILSCMHQMKTKTFRDKKMYFVRITIKIIPSICLVFCVHFYLLFIYKRNDRMTRHWFSNSPRVSFLTEAGVPFADLLGKNN